MQSLRQISAHLEQTAEALKFSQSCSQHAVDSFVISFKNGIFFLLFEAEGGNLGFWVFSTLPKSCLLVILNK